MNDVEDSTTLLLFNSKKRRLARERADDSTCLTSNFNINMPVRTSVNIIPDTVLFNTYFP